MADKQNGQDLGIRNVRWRQGKRVRRQRGDLRIGGEKFPGRIRRRARRVFARGPAGAEILPKDRIDAGARVLKKMVVNNDRAPRRFGAYSRAGMSVTHLKSLAKARPRKVFLRPALVNGHYGSLKLPSALTPPSGQKPGPLGASRWQAIYDNGAH